MKIKPIYYIVGATTTLLLSALFLLNNLNKMLGKVTKNNQIRTQDNHGSGHFGASRDNGKRKHAGIDIVALPNEPIYSPINGVVTRHPFPYGNDLKFKGIEIKDKDLVIKIFYLNPTITQGTSVKKGQIIGYAQDLTNKYKGITNHVHLEVKDKLGKLINPETLI